MDPMFQILIFAALAAFVLFRLYMVLGRRVGRQPPPPPAPGRPRALETEPSTAETLRPAFTGPGAAGLEAIHRADSGFTPESFIEGARGAYEMIVQAFAEGDRQTLQRFLAPPVYEKYDAAIADREQRGLTQTTDLVRLSGAKIDDAELDGRMARVKVAFDAELNTVLRDAEGVVVEGDPSRTRPAHEVWTFERDVKARDPNWMLAKVSRA
jgi:predicted lipid-binding transport protein (Tim44 family)